MYRCCYCRSAETHMALSEKLYAEYATLQLPVLASHPVAEALHRSADLWLCLHQLCTRSHIRNYYCCV